MKEFLTQKNLLIMGLTALAVAATGMLTTSNVQRKYETKLLQHPSAKLAAGETRNSEWSKAYPQQWSSYMAATARGNPSSQVTDELEINPKLAVLWAGYGFSKDYNKPRGHPFAVVDTVNSLRTGAPKDQNTGPMPATCMTCKSPDVPRLMKEEGVKQFYAGKWARHVKQVTNPIGCADCHDSETMELQITRPALVEALERQGKKMAEVSHQDMRSLVCAQCHVEYYFKKPGAYLTFPWDEGMGAEAMEAYYDQRNFKDWTHKVSKAPMLKAQHPGYELFTQGIHAKRQVACADCHMPYKTVGGTKFSDHHIQSPLQNVSNACQQCHRESESNLIANVADLKAKILNLKGQAEDLLVAAHFEAGKAWDQGASDADMKASLTLIRHAQWRWDYATAAHGSYFHAPEETLRILGQAIAKAGEARLQLSRILMAKGFSGTVEIPDISTKAKAQTAIGIDYDQMASSKQEFLRNLALPWWDASPVKDEKLMQLMKGELNIKP